MDKKEEFIQKLDAQLREWSARIDELKVKSDKTKADIKIKYASLFEALDEKRELAQNKLEELKKASGPAWEEVKRGAENAWHELKTSIDSAMTKFREH